jgi:hypothetical protein
MRMLFGWGNPNEADLLRLYLAAGDNEVEVAFTSDEFLSRSATSDRIAQVHPRLRAP